MIIRSLHTAVSTESGAFEMAKKVRLIVAVAAEKLADLIGRLTAEEGVTVALATGDAAEPVYPDPIDDDEDEEVTAAMARQSKRKQAAVAPTPTRRSLNPRPGGRVIYTPAGTQKQITAMLAQLTKGTMTAAVLTDIAKHPGTSNAEVRARLAPFCKKTGLSVESVDNVIWQQVNKGRILKEAAEV